MVKLMLQIAAEMLNCMVPPQRDNEHFVKCFYPVAQHKLKVSMVKPVLQSTAEVNMAESREPPQRDKEHLAKCFHQALQDKSEVSMVKPVLQNTAEVDKLK